MSNIRISGIASGFDTDQMIKDLMKAENARVDNIRKEKQMVEWQQEAYRDIIDQVKSLQSNFLDVLKPGSNIASASSFSKFSYSVLSNGATSTALSITASSSASRAMVVNEITALATKDNWLGKVTGKRGIESGAINVANIKATVGSGDFELSLTVGSQSKVIRLTNAELTAIPDGNSADFVAAINNKIKLAFGNDFGSVASLTTDGKLKLDFSSSEVKVMTYGSNSASMSALGLTSGQSSYAFRSKSVSELFGVGDSTLTINGKNVSISGTDTIAQMVDKINAGNTGSQISYNLLSDRFQLQSTTEGSANNVAIDSGSATENTLSKLFNITDFSDAGLTRTEGLNAKLKIDGVEMIQSTNAFTYEGVNFTLKTESASAIQIKADVDSTPILDNITKFIEAYNGLIDGINKKLSEKKDYDYKPLTTEEKEALTEKEVEAYEAKAKMGILRGSSELNDFVMKLRNAITEPIAGLGLNLRDVGITSESYQDRGKLTIDESVLKQKLETNFDDVVKLFSKQASTAYSADSGAAPRLSSNGIGNRFDDIIKDYTRTIRDSGGRKGVLINIAGVGNDISNVQNDLTKRMTTFDTRIDKLLDTLADKEDYYYRMFSNMESALSQMQAQSSSLTSMLGS